MRQLVPPWIIEHRRRREQDRREDLPRPMLPIFPLNEYFEAEYDGKEDKEPPRGVIILDMVSGEEIVKSDNCR